MTYVTILCIHISFFMVSFPREGEQVSSKTIETLP